MMNDSRARLSSGQPGRSSPIRNPIHAVVRMVSASVRARIASGSPRTDNTKASAHTAVKAAASAST